MTEVQIAYLLAVAIAISGALVHWAKRYFRSQTELSLSEYIFGNDRFGTMTSFGSIAFSALTMVEKGAVDPTTFAGAGTVFAIGYMCDSMFNGEKRK